MELEEGKSNASDIGNTTTTLECTVSTNNTSIYNTLDDNRGNVCEYSTLDDITISSKQIKTRSVDTQTTNELSEEIFNESPVQVPNQCTKTVWSLQVASVVVIVFVPIMAGIVTFLMFKQVSNITYCSNKRLTRVVNSCEIYEARLVSSCISYDRLKLDFIAFKMNNISRKKRIVDKHGRCL